MAIGSIRNRTTGKHPCWQVTLDLGNHPITGKRQRVYKTVYGTKKQAEQELKQMLVSLTNTGSVPTSQPLVLLSSWMEEWMRLYLPHVAETTRRSYEEKTKNHINPMLGHFPINKLTTDKIQGAMNELIGVLSPKSIRNTFNILNAALKKAVQQHLIPYNPCAGVVLNKIPKYHPQVFNATEVQQALALASNNRTIFTIIVLGGLLGLRRGELTGLRWDDIDFKNSTITIKNNRVNGRNGVTEKDPKSESGKRTLSLGADVMDALSQIKGWYDEYSRNPFWYGKGYVLFKDDGSPYAPDSVTQLWTRFVERHNLKKLRLHDLRHTNATLLISGGVDARTVQHRLGHSDVSTTLNRYVHVLPGMDRSAADTLDAMIFQQTPPQSPKKKTP